MNYRAFDIFFQERYLVFMGILSKIAKGDLGIFSSGGTKLRIFFLHKIIIALLVNSLLFVCEVVCSSLLSQFFLET